MSSHGLSTLESRRRTWEVRPCLSSSFSSFAPLSSPASACSASVHAAMHLPQKCLQGWMWGWDCCWAPAKPSRLLLCHGCCQAANFAPPHGDLGGSLASTTRRPGPSCRCCPPPTCETPEDEPRGCSRCGVCRCALPPTGNASHHHSNSRVLFPSNSLIPLEPTATSFPRAAPFLCRQTPSHHHTQAGLSHHPETRSRRCSVAAGSGGQSLPVPLCPLWITDSSGRPIQQPWMGALCVHGH